LAVVAAVALICRRARHPYKDRLYQTVITGGGLMRCTVEGIDPEPALAVFAV
jgi:hypothetical protein